MKKSAFLLTVTSVALLLAGGVRSQPNVTDARPELVFHETFDGLAENRVPAGWQATAHLPPNPRTVVRAGAGREGSSCLELINEIGRKPHVFLNVSRPMEGLGEGRRYRLSVWVKGGGEGADTSRLIGICSDQFGNKKFSYVAAWTPKDEWQQVTVDFSAKDTPLNVIIRNDRQLAGLLIDGITVKEINR